MDLVHDSPFIGALESVLDRDGSEVRVALLKATYALDDSGRLRIAEEQEALWQTDQYLSEPGSSVLYSMRAMVRTTSQERMSLLSAQSSLQVGDQQRTVSASSR